MNDMVGIYGMAQNGVIRGLAPYMQTRSKKKYVMASEGGLSEEQFALWDKLTDILPIPFGFTRDNDKR